MIFGFWKRRKRERLLAEPFPAEWERVLRKNFDLYKSLGQSEQAKLRDDLRVFMAEKYWEGCGGLRMREEVQVTIAAQACFLVIGLDVDEYGQVSTVLVYPTGFITRQAEEDEFGVVYEEEEDMEGEAWPKGTVVLSWSDALTGGKRSGDGRNLIFHEFAHQLDMRDGVIDGTPVLGSKEQYRRWVEVMEREFEELQEMADLGKRTFLDQYGATDESEFFAVTTEAFFEQPAILKRRHPDLYEVLGDYYRQDPAARLPEPEEKEIEPQRHRGTEGKTSRNRRKRK
jgi:Mlc titration factor MtfA (ptsG expression regulator)